MAKRKGNGESKSGYWRKLFTETPSLLRDSNNQGLIERWEKDHPGQKFTERDRGTLANTKSLMRKKLGIGRRRRRRKAAAMAGAANATTGAAVKSHATVAALERLEVSIDHCLARARELDPAGLEKAIKHLRAARNEVVWKGGEP